jgi:uncharacterized protein (TIGR03437 family)
MMIKYAPIFLFACQALIADVKLLSGLPAGAFAGSIRVDAAGNIYVAGSMSNDAFAAKLVPDGSQVIWATKFGGSADDRAMALALGADGSVYLTGNTLSTDFPTTPGAMQPAKSGGGAFAAKLDPNGVVAYATYIGGPAGTQGNAISVDSAGHAFITGLTFNVGAETFPTAGGSVIIGDRSSTSGYVLELNPTGSAAVLAIRGFGGYQIATDAQGNIYAAGALLGSAQTTPGAYQSSSARVNCAFTMIMTIPCSYQHIAKIDPTGMRLIYGTYITGQWEAIPSGMAVNADGSVILAGSARGADYPTTPGAYQSIYAADPNGNFQPIVNFTAPVTAGYVTKLNSDGTAVLWSTYFGGSGSITGNTPLGDTINGMAIDSNGNILITGTARSSDLPGLWNVSVASRPTVSGVGFVARLSKDGGRISATQLTASQPVGIVAQSDGTAVVAMGGLATVTFPPDGRVYAIADPADNARVVNVAPGQFLTLYGVALANGSVTFNGIQVQILYAADGQINLQVPMEIAGLTEVTMQVSNPFALPPVSESYILGVVARHPSVFLRAINFFGPIFGEQLCNGATYYGAEGVATNPDGSLNTCSNPAPAGSTVNLYLNGLGMGNPEPSIMAIKLPATGGPAITIPLTISGTRAREQAFVWMKPVN